MKVFWSESNIEPVEVVHDIEVPIVDLRIEDLELPTSKYSFRKTGRTLPYLHSVVTRLTEDPSFATSKTVMGVLLKVVKAQKRRGIMGGKNVPLIIDLGNRFPCCKFLIERDLLEMTREELLHAKGEIELLDEPILELVLPILKKLLEKEAAVSPIAPRPLP